MITTTDDPREVNRCHELGCSHYITKPVDYEKFVEAVHKLGNFVDVVEIPKMIGKSGRRN
jgi:DNA-binding NarL/FixJ family response regulator